MGIGGIGAGDADITELEDDNEEDIDESEFKDIGDIRDTGGGGGLATSTIGCIGGSNGIICSKLIGASGRSFCLINLTGLDIAPPP
jgi:hypothetical protein